MPDVFTKKKRSEVMSRIRSRGNRDTEMVMLRMLQALGIKGWRRHVALSLKVPGPRFPVKGSRVRPDFVFHKRRVALFVDGCFWHACPLHSTKPRGNAAFWREKLARNQARDRAVTRLLKAKSWKVLRIWEHELAAKHRGKLERKLIRRLKVG